MRKAIAVLALVLGMGSSLCAQDAILSVMAEKSGIIAHVKVLEIEGGFVDEMGVTEWHALCEVVEPMKGDSKKKDKIQFYFTIFDYKEKREPVRVEKGKEYIIFLESKTRGGYRFLSQDKMGATHELVDRWLGVMTHEHYLAERLTKYILPDQGVVFLSPLPGSREDSTIRTISIVLPADIHADAVTLLVGAYGPGLNLARVQTEEGKYSYTHELPGSATSVKILAHYPGTKVVTAEFAIDDPALSQPFSPVFEPLPMIPATLKLVDTNGKPLTGLKVSLNQQLGTMEFFSFSDGMVWSGPVAAGKVRRERDFVIYYESADVFTTDDRGEFKLQLPSLQDDAYFKRVGIEEPSFGISVPSRTDEEDGFGWYPTPSTITARKKYEKPITVTMTYYGKVDVSISEALLDELDVPAEARKSLTIMLARPDGSGTGRTLDPDGSGMVKWVRPGTYEIRLEVPPVGPDGKSRSILLEKEVYIGEKEVLSLKR